MSVYRSFPVVMLACALAVCAVAQGRPMVDLDGTWQFRLDPDGTGETSGWFQPGVAFEEAIVVPGAWEAQGFGEPTEKLRHHFLGKGWYRRTVEAPADWRGKRIFLCVGGVRRYAKVWANGHYLGEHIGYVSPFEYELTAHVRPGATVDLVICVDSVQREEIDTLIGCFDIIDYMDTYWGGIWGHVRLEARSAAYLEDLFVAPRVNPTSCDVSAAVLGDPEAADTVELSVLTTDGRVLARTARPLAEALRAGRATLDLDVPDAALWSPRTPNLHHARLRLLRGETEVDRVETRFGFREIEVRGMDILLNGTRIFLHGYGDDCVYPETMAAPSDKETYLRRLALAKDLGFNHVRHHSATPPPDYFEACDEVGMLVSPELPIAYQQFYDRATETALELYRTQWAALIRRLRNHPSILDWCMGNEMWHGVPIAPDLYRIAKELDPTRPVVDSDGLFVRDVVHEGLDRDTLDLLFVMFDVFNTPLDLPDKFFCPELPKPVISHETGNYVTFPRLDQIELFRHNFKPFWLEPVRARLEAMGLSHEAEQWAENSEKLYMLCHKANIEALRKNPNISGYHWWLLQDYWTTTNGIVDAYYRVKPGIDLEEVRRLNADALLLEDGLEFTYRAGDTVSTRLMVSNFGPGPLAPAVLAYRMLCGDAVIAEGSLTLETVPQGDVTPVGEIAAVLPEVDGPRRVRLEAALVCGEARYDNRWTAWAYPRSAGVAAAAGQVFATPESLPAVARFGARPVSEATGEARVFVSSLPTPAMLEAVDAGATLILLRPMGVFASTPMRFKTAWWRGSASDSTAGTLVYDHPVTRDIAPDGWCDTGWYRLIENADGFLLDGLPAKPDVIVRGIEVLHACRDKAMLFQTGIGKGTLIVSGLNLEPEYPEAEWMLAQLIAYAFSPRPSRSAFPLDYLRPLCVDLPTFEGAVADGFAELTENTGEEARYFSYREAQAPYFICRQLSASQRIAWKTAPVAAASASDGVTFVFAGALGWSSEPAVGGFALDVNGREAIRFDTDRGVAAWRNDETGASLLFVPRKMTDEDRAGLFYLTLPAGRVAPGEACSLAVRSVGADSRRWFGLNPYTGLAGGE